MKCCTVPSDFFKTEIRSKKTAVAFFTAEAQRAQRFFSLRAFAFLRYTKAWGKAPRNKIHRLFTKSLFINILLCVILFGSSMILAQNEI